MGKRTKSLTESEAGFTLVEVILAGSLMIVMAVGILSVFSYVVKINRGNNLRAQALTVLQQDVEYYRSLKFIPVASDTAMNGGTYTNVRTRNSADGRAFYISVTIDNDLATAGIQNTNESTCKFKEIKITAVPVIAETGWLANLKTDVTIQRVRSN